MPWAPAPLDFGRDAVTVLGLRAGLYLLGVAMLSVSENHRLALAALVVAVVILGIALRDWLDAVERVGAALSGLAVVAFGGLVAGVGPSHGSSSAALTGASEGFEAAWNAIHDATPVG